MRVFVLISKYMDLPETEKISNYEVIGNSAALNEFYEMAMEMMYKWLNRRS